MTPQELKASILLMAVNGVLVDQDETEEPAKNFINPIRKEQERLIKARIIKKEKFSDNIDYTEELPNGWCYVKLGELTTVVTKQTGFDYSKSIKPNLLETKQPGSIPMVQTKNFKGKTFDMETDYYIPLVIAEQFPKILLNSKCMLLSIVGASIGNVGIYDLPAVAMIGGAICKVSLIDERLYEYLYYYLQSPLGQQEIKKNLKATAQGTITVQDVREIVIKMPPLVEQKRIVAKVEELLPYIDRYEQAWSRLEDFNKRFPADMQKSILQMAIQGKLVPQIPEEGTGEELFQQIQTEKQTLIKAGTIKKEKPLPEITEDEIPFDIPESWKWYRIGELFNIVNGFTPLKSNPEFWTDGDLPWFTIEDVRRQGRFISSTEKFITPKALAKNTERIVPADTVLLCCTASVGEYAYTKIPLTTNQQFNAFVVKDYYKNAVYPLYVFEYAKTLKGSLIDRAGKTTFNFVSVGKLSNMLIPLPPLAEQKRIVAKLEEILPLCERLK